jgi:hypothetical protein
MCMTDPYRREGGSVSDERVEKLVQQVDRDTFGALAKSQLGAVRAALQEARREALKQAAKILDGMADDDTLLDMRRPESEANYGYAGRRLAAAKNELERLAGEEGTK